MDLWLTLFTSLISGLAAYAVSTYFYVRHERRKVKLDVLRTLMGSRHGLTVPGGPEAKARFFEALNSVFAVFHDSTQVIEALQDFKKHRDRSADNVTQLLRRISEDLSIDTSYLDDDFFADPFVPGNIT